MKPAHRFTPHGPRGVMMFGFGIVSLTFGDAYILNPNSGRSLAWLSELIPLPWFGALWAFVGLWLVLAAYSVRQSRALGAFAGMCFLWGTAYTIATILSLANSNGPGPYILVPVFYGFSLACGAAVRMTNPAPLHAEVVIKPGPPRPRKRGGGRRG